MILALTGLAGSGKTTVADYVVRERGFFKVNFKDALVSEMKENLSGVLSEIVLIMDKIAYNGVNPWTIERLFKEKPPLMRALMQNYGTEVRRGDDENYWTNRWADKISGADRHIVVDDCRFLNEADAVHKMDGVIVRIVRTDIINTITHQSEVEMESIKPDYTITCGAGEHDKLFSEIREIITKHAETGAHNGE